MTPVTDGWFSREAQDIVAAVLTIAEYHDDPATIDTWAAARGSILDELAADRDLTAEVLFVFASAVVAADRELAARGAPLGRFIRAVRVPKR
ncbi:MAG: hypothetical protein ACRDXE_10480 [Acidimicrobiales bacterium]